MERLPLVSPLDRILFLKAQPYLVSQPPELLTVLASYTEEEFFSAGTSMRSGEGPVDRILFLVEGRVSVRVLAGSEVQSREVSAPGIVGIPHHFSGASDPPEVRAIEDTLCLALQVSDLDQILEDHFSLALSFAKRSSEEALHTARSLGSLRPDEDGFAEEAHPDTPVTLDIVQRLALSRRAPLFERANLTVLGQLIRQEEVAILKRGDILWKEGDAIDRMELVLDGSLQAVGNYGACVAPSGAVVGAWEILSDQPRAEGWVATSTCRVLPIRRDLFTDLLEDHHDFALDYLRCCCERSVAGWGALAALNADQGRARA